MLLLQQMVIFFLIMLIGYICRKVGVFGENTGKMISGIVINIGNPALIIASGMNPETLENKAALLVTLAVALIFFAIMFVIAELIPRLLRADREDYGSYQVMTIFANIGFMGYPLLDAMYGGEAVIHAAIFNLLYSVLIYTYGINRMKTSGQREKLNWKQLMNVRVISCLIAVTLYISNLPVPMVFKDTATRIGAVTGPLSMLVIGDSLAQIRLKDLFTDVRLLLFSVVKLLLMPALLLWGLRAESARCRQRRRGNHRAWHHIRLSRPDCGLPWHSHHACLRSSDCGYHTLASAAQPECRRDWRSSRTHRDGGSCRYRIGCRWLVY